MPRMPVVCFGPRRADGKRWLQKFVSLRLAKAGCVDLASKDHADCLYRLNQVCKILRYLLWHLVKAGCDDAESRVHVEKVYLLHWEGAESWDPECRWEASANPVRVCIVLASCRSLVALNVLVLPFIL